MPEANARGPLAQLVTLELARLKPDHQELMKTLLADAGMAAATLETLVEHLLEEEGPTLQSLAARVRLGVPPAIASASRAHRGTVGDLRGRPLPTRHSAR